MNMLAAIKPKSDQLNSDDLIGGPRTITVAGVSFSGGPEQPVSLAFDGDGGKSYKPCKSMCRVLVAIWGPDAKAYTGESMTLYRDPTVQFGGLAVGGIRISHMTGIAEPRTMALTASKAKRAPFTVRPLVIGDKPVTFSLDDARADIEAASTLDELKAVWTRKTMAPYRPELQAELDARKLALSGPGEGPADIQRGEQHLDSTGAEVDAQTALALDIEARAAKVELIADLNALAAEAKPHIDAMSNDLAARCDVAIAGARERLAGGK